ncbi:MAG: low molecular weight phosphatase family protein [Nocardioidaceae bacterium]
MSDRRPTILVACVQNAGRSQAAAALLQRYTGDRFRVLMGGSKPADQVHPVVSAVLAERGLAVQGAPRAWTDHDVQEADVVVTMGCGDACPFYPGKRYEEWEVEDPSGQDIDRVRLIVDDIDAKVQGLLSSL